MECTAVSMKVNAPTPRQHPGHDQEYLQEQQRCAHQRAQQLPPPQPQQQLHGQALVQNQCPYVYQLPHVRPKPLRLPAITSTRRTPLQRQEMTLKKAGRKCFLNRGDSLFSLGVADSYPELDA